jgi:hypothetical protein
MRFSDANIARISCLQKIVNVTSRDQMSTNIQLQVPKARVYKNAFLRVTVLVTKTETGRWCFCEVRCSNPYFSSETVIMTGGGARVFPRYLHAGALQNNQSTNRESKCAASNLTFGSSDRGMRKTVT